MRLDFEKILLFLICSMFFGCAATALERYDGKVYQPSIECKVKTLHDIEYAKYYIETELKDYAFMGTSNFRIDEDYFYTEKEAKNDCMKIGADLVIVINLGVVDSYSGQINYTTTTPHYNYANVNTNTSYYSSNYGYVGNSRSYGTIGYTTYTTNNHVINYTENITGYRVLFFKR